MGIQGKSVYRKLPIISSYIHSSPLSHSHPTRRVAVDLVERKKDGNGESMKGEDWK